MSHPHVVLDRQQHDIGTFGPAIRHRPLNFDHAPDAAQMLTSFVRSLSGGCTTWTRKPAITKNLDSHFQFSVTGRS